MRLAFQTEMLTNHVAVDGAAVRLTHRLLLLTCALVALAFVTRAAETNVTRRFEFREPHQAAYHIRVINATNDMGKRLFAGNPGDEWTPARIDGSTNTVELGSRVVLQLKPGHGLDAFLASSSLTLARTVSSNLFILQAADAASAIAAAETLARQEGTLASYPVMRRSFKRHDAYAKAPNDPLFQQQWNLDNRGKDRNLAGPDLNIRAAWPMTRGEGVVVAVVDDGVQLDHPDLKSRITGPNFNFYRNSTNGGPASSSADHATAVAGLIAAEADNARGVVGVSPGAQLASWVIFGTSRGLDSIANDEQLMNMFEYAGDRVAVQNHSWGSASTAQLGIEALSEAGIAAAVNKGRGGKGVVIVRAAGNDRESLTDANDDGLASDPRVIAVAAIRKDGRACSYSSPGACVLVAAPSGDVIDSDGDGVPEGMDPVAPDVLTTDLTGTAGQNVAAGVTGDTAGFNGTSASSPQVAGVVALVLSANPGLTYRDVQQILIQSERHFDLNDPNIRLNGAGLRVSHNVGFGVADAGFAVRLAKLWSNRPPVTTLTLTNTTRQEIPDDALRLVCSGDGIVASLTSIRCLPSLGPHADDPTPDLPLVDFGQANEELPLHVKSKGALIQRGTSYFEEKIARAARAGASFAVIFNNTGTTGIQPMGGTTFVPIPAVSIGKNDGELLRNFIATHLDATARLQLRSAIYRFKVSDTLVCESIGLRLKTTHTSRSDVRMTLVSPAGTRSVLQSVNSDTLTGPRDWTYWSSQHFYESSVGEWRVEVSDERDTNVRTFGSSTAATGAVTYVQLLIRGVAITDKDGDGLDDAWEMKWFGTLAFGPKDDPDQDGFNNAREQVMGTDPTSSETEFRLDLAELQSGFWRLSWPGREGETYAIESGTDLGLPFTASTFVRGRFPVTEHIVPASMGARNFYRVNRKAGQ